MRHTTALIALFFIAINVFSQGENPVISLFPKGTILHANIPYSNDQSHKHKLDIYLPQQTNKAVPVVIFVHGGGWRSNDKYADMGYMGNTLRSLIESGFAVASIDYRFSTEAIFPAQIKDCNRAISFLYDHAKEYHLDRNHMAVMGFSAGGHLASLIGLSKNNNAAVFFEKGTSKSFGIRAVVDFYGLTDLLLVDDNDDPQSFVSVLLGAAPISRPDLAKTASPVTYVDKNDPPFLIIHGEKDKTVSNKQSKLLQSWLTINGVQNELIIVKDAPHYGEMFDTEPIRTKVIAFLKKHLR